MYSALIGYIWYEAPEEEQNFSTLLEFINASETREDDEEFKNAVDELFEELEAENAVLVAGIQYSDNLSSSLFGVMAYTVILCYSLFKTASLSKSIFNAH